MAVLGGLVVLGGAAGVHWVAGTVHGNDTVAAVNAHTDKMNGEAPTRRSW